MGDRYIILKEHHKSLNKIDVEIIEKDDLEVPDSNVKSEYNTYVESRLIAGRIKGVS